jgi:hypothetical protein
MSIDIREEQNYDDEYGMPHKTYYIHINGSNICHVFDYSWAMLIKNALEKEYEEYKKIPWRNLPK